MLATETAREGEDKMTIFFKSKVSKKRAERPYVGDASIRSRSGAPSRKGRVVNGQTTKASNK